MLNKRITCLERDMIELVNNSGVNVATVTLILDKLLKEAQASLEEIIKKEEQVLAQQQSAVTEYDIHPDSLED